MSALRRRHSDGHHGPSVELVLQAELAAALADVHGDAALGEVVVGAVESEQLDGKGQVDPLFPAPIRVGLLAQFLPGSLAAFVVVPIVSRTPENWLERAPGLLC